MKEPYKKIRVASGKYVREHVLVMEKILGHKIPRGYNVHHINLDVSDNRPENLLLCTISEHRKIHCKIRRMNGGSLSEEELAIGGKERARLYYIKNKEKIKQRARLYKKNNAEKVRQAQKEYRERNKEKCAEYKRRYYYSHQKQISESGRLYREKNKEKIRERDRAYKARVRHPQR